MEATLRRKPGRPKGSRNKVRPIGNPPAPDYTHADPLTLIARQFSMIDFAQRSLRAELDERISGRVDESDVQRLLTMANAICRNVDALRKAENAMSALQSNLTPAELLEAAIKKIEGQDIPTITYAIRRLRAFRASVSPQQPTALASLAALDDDAV